MYIPAVVGVAGACVVTTGGCVVTTGGCVVTAVVTGASVVDALKNCYCQC